VLAPLERGGVPRYRFFDWVQDRYTEQREVPPGPVLIVEGVGAGSRIVRPYLSYVVWVEAPSALRLARGLERDGAAREPEWKRWRAKEDALFATRRRRVTRRTSSSTARRRWRMTPPGNTSLSDSAGSGAARWLDPCIKGPSTA
jgi:hypothetical protein